MRIIDFHTHAFPDSIAAAAIGKLQAASHTRPFTDGTVTGLRNSMTEAGISASVVLPVATHPRQVPHVNDASIALNDQAESSGIYSFGCMHPDYADVRRELKRIADAGIRGIKLHPVYQGVDFDDPRYLRILDAAGDLGLTVLIHAGLDVGFPGVTHASPRMILNAVRSVGPVTLVLAHMGGWRCWEQVERLLPDTPVLLDTSFSLGVMTPNGDGKLRTQEELRMLVHPALPQLREHDAETGSELYDTLRAYLENERSLVKTAAALCIHRNTLLYRLEKLRQLVELDLEDPELRLHLEISFRLMERL